MKKLLILMTLFAVAGMAQGSVTFFVAPNAYPATSTTLDLGFQAAAGTIEEFDFDGYGNHFDLDSFNSVLWPTLTIDVGTGASSTAEIFGSSYSSGAYGTVSTMALLNRGSAGERSSQITFDFSDPVSAVGAWMFDNSSNTDDRFRMIVTESDATITISGILESGNGTGNHFVEGFLGVTSDIGIVSVAFEVLNGQGRPTNTYFELDHLQVSGPVIPAPGALLLGSMGMGIVGWLRRRRMM